MVQTIQIKGGGGLSSQIKCHHRAGNIRQVRKGSNEKINQLIKDMNSGLVHTLIMSGVNPIYSLSNYSDFSEGLLSSFL